MLPMQEKNPTVDIAVILAAGIGSRFGSSKENAVPKPLIPVLGKPLILRTLTSLERSGCRKVVIILGYGREIVQSAVKENYKGALELIFKVNGEYSLSNGVSALCAAPHVGNTFILTMADHIFDESLMRLAVEHQPPQNGATLLVDYKIDTIFDLDDATKVFERYGKIVSIGKKIQPYNCIDTGIFVCTDRLFEHLENEYRSQGDVSLSAGVRSLSEKETMTVLDIGESFWQDVDTSEMLRHAESCLRKTEERS
jgi:choline kinase